MGDRKKIILEVMSEINQRINPNAYYQGVDIQDILLDAEEELIGKED